MYTQMEWRNEMDEWSLLAWEMTSQISNELDNYFALNMAN